MLFFSLVVIEGKAIQGAQIRGALGFFDGHGRSSWRRKGGGRRGRRGLGNGGLVFFSSSTARGFVFTPLALVCFCKLFCHTSAAVRILYGCKIGLIASHPANWTCTRQGP